MIIITAALIVARHCVTDLGGLGATWRPVGIARFADACSHRLVAAAIKRNAQFYINATFCSRVRLVVAVTRFHRRRHLSFTMRFNLRWRQKISSSPQLKPSAMSSSTSTLSKQQSTHHRQSTEGESHTNSSGQPDSPATKPLHLQLSSCIEAFHTELQHDPRMASISNSIDLFRLQALIVGLASGTDTASGTCVRTSTLCVGDVVWNTKGLCRGRQGQLQPMR